MAITPIRTLLFVAGGLAAATGTAYVSGALDPYLTKQPTTVGSLPNAPLGEADSKTARLSVEEPPAATEPQAGGPAAVQLPANAAAGIVAPSFDVVRVEGDGSIVIAGKADAGAKVEIVIGSHVIGQAVTGPDGDFAVVLEDPLKPGGYQIVLRSTTPDNVVAMSVETAVVSVPETKDGQVLALVEEPGKPSEMISVPQPQAKPEAPAAGDQANAPATKQPATAAPKPEDQAEAALQPEPAPADKPDAATTAKPTVVVEAVEIEGRTVFVAGTADPGRKVRGYANDILLGDAEVSPGGRFLIEAERDLPVGDYIIRVDALEPDGVKVAARAAVPFGREPGEAIAAVAPRADTQTPAAETPASQTPSAAAEAPVVQSPPTETDMATGETPTIEPVQPGAAQTVAKAPPAELAQPGDGNAGAEAPAVELSQPGTPAPSSPPTVAETPKPGAEPEVEIAGTPADGAAETAPAQNVPTTTAPKLQSIDGAVIIRRGDTLWRISRRVYGRGVRYSTIYLANQKQIADPDRIWPGQVFTVPEKSSEGEAADLTGMGNQVTTVPQ